MLPGFQLLTGSIDLARIGTLCSAIRRLRVGSVKNAKPSANPLINLFMVSNWPDSKGVQRTGTEAENDFEDTAHHVDTVINTTSQN